MPPSAPATSKRGSAKAATERVAGIALTHPDRVLWEGQGITKRDLARYHEAVAGHLLPHAANRPLTLVRCPGGSGTSCFFAKHPWAGLDPAVEAVRVGDDEAVAVRDPAGLVALVQAGVLEIHPWGATLADPERPDRLVIDLDPAEDVGFDAVRAAALEVRGRLEAAGLVGFLKTTGGKGLHVVAPLVPRAGWEEARAFAAALAGSMEHDAPSRFTHASRKAERTGRIFVDYLRNTRGATAVAPYSPRARPGAPVATPLAWDELTPGLRPGDLTVATVPARLAGSTRDPWEGFAAAARPLPTSLERGATPRSSRSPPPPASRGGASRGA
ncbi:non-homologous end-joining DNA ligase [Salinarimonas soli]|uniref:DNA polymerase domain-containing protein n=1 Tax=Salinarimonas soli TaxID=1638099 RepID=A0A5B2V730_9HYPH|nr:non-homologous end-joining DNA ligase [Salinarimonas soli]KAA2234375.1 DNA polymerase domain-containing protein [Salinarimonas soli]